MRHLGLRPCPRRPGVDDAKTLAGGEPLLVLEHAALGEAGERNVLQRKRGLLERRARDVELAFSAVDHQQVGQVLLLDSALQPAGKDLEHGSEVVSGRLAAHLEEPVAALVGLTVAEHDLRADGELALEGGDVEALDPSREPRQPQPRLQPRERLQLALLRARLFLVALARVLHRHLHQPHLLAALRHVHAHALALLLRQPDLAHLRIGEVHRQEQLLGDERARLVVLVEEAREQLLARELLLAEPEAPAAGEPPVAEEEEVDLQRRTLAIEAEDVLVEEVAEHRALFLQAALDGVELIAKLRGALELELAGGVLHPPRELAGQLVGLSLQEQRDFVDRAPVFLLRHAVHARRGAALDLVLQARAPAIRHHGIGAGAKLEVPVDDRERLPDGGGAGERPEVPRSVLADPAHHLQPRVRVRVREPQRDEVLVVAQLDVEARTELLDQLVLEQHRVLLRGSDHHLHVGEEILEEGDERARVATALLEILADP